MNDSLIMVVQYILLLGEFVLFERDLKSMGCSDVRLGELGFALV